MEECVFLQTTDMLKLLHYLYVATLHSFNTNFPFHFGTCLGIPSAVATNMAGKCTDLRKYELWKVCSMSMSCASLLSERSRLLRINSECVFVLLFFLNIIHLIFFFHSSHAEVLCQKISLCALCHTFYAQMWVNVRTQNWLHILARTPAVLFSNIAYKTK